MDAIYVRWHGPFTYEAIKKNVHLNGQAKDLEDFGLYAFTGLLKYQRGPARLQYIGITIEQTYRTRFMQHPIRQLITRKYEIWLGKVERTRIDERIRRAEHMLIYFTNQLINCPIIDNGNAGDKDYLLNTQLMHNRPDFACSVTSQFFRKNSMNPRSNVPLAIQGIPEILIWKPTTFQLRYSQRLKRRQYAT